MNLERYSNYSAIGKKLKLTSNVYEDLVYPEQFVSLYEAIQPKFNYGTNNPNFNNKNFYNDSKFNHTFISIHDILFLVSFGPTSSIKFAVVKDPSNHDKIMDLVLKANLRETKNVSYSITAELFNSIIGVILDYIDRFKPKQVSFSGLSPAHTKLYTRAANNKRFIELFNNIGYITTIYNETILISKEN